MHSLWLRSASSKCECPTLVAEKRLEPPECVAVARQAELAECRRTLEKKGSRLYALVTIGLPENSSRRTMLVTDLSQSMVIGYHLRNCR